MLFRSCPDKPMDIKSTNQKRKNPKAQQAKVDEHETSDGETTYEDPEIEAWVCKGQTLKTEDTETITRWAWEAETGMLVGPEADF